MAAGSYLNNDINLNALISLKIYGPAPNKPIIANKSIIPQKLKINFKRFGFE